MIVRVCLFFSLLGFWACDNKTKYAESLRKTEVRALNELDWILGKWKREDTGELELWSKKEDGFFGGMMVTVKGEKQAVIKEVLSIEGRPDGIFFSFKQNGVGKNSRFEYKMSNQNFEAPKFSKIGKGYFESIFYMKIGNDKIKVELEDRTGRETTYYYIREI